MNPFAPRWMRAPGKLMWIGEYAVLDGAPSLVSAIDRYGALRWETTPGDPNDLTLTLRSTLSENAWVLRDENGHIRNNAPALWQLAAAVAEAITAAGRELIDQGGDIFISTNALSGEDVKLGLGSSAAVAALLTTTLVRGPLDNTTCYTIARDAHRRFQNGAGSGADVAACTLGGLLCVQKDKEPEALSPPPLQLAIVHTGVEADTRAMIRALHSARETSPEVQRTLEEMGKSATRAIDAIRTVNDAAFLREVRTYHQLERALSSQSGVNIVTDEIENAVTLIESCGGAAKASGAGGGDIVVGFFPEGASRDRLMDMCTNAGLTALRVEVEPSGVLELSQRPLERSARREHR